MKGKLFLLVALALTSSMAASVQADTGNMSIIVNGEYTSTDTPPVIEGEQTLLPLRPILEKLGATVEWNEENRTVTCILGEKRASFAINSQIMDTSHGKVTLNVPAKIINSRTMVPINAISEGIGAEIIQNNEDNTVIINYGEEDMPYTYQTVTENITENDRTILTITTEYPVIKGDKYKALNEYIEKDALSKTAYYKELYSKELSEHMPISEDIDTSNWSVDLYYDIATLTDKLVSLYITESSYLGGAHPNTLARGITYSLTKEKPLRADDLVENAYEKAKAGVKARAEEKPDDYPFYEDSFSFDADEFYVTNNQLVFLIQQYEVAPYASGIMEYVMNI